MSLHKLASLQRAHRARKMEEVKLLGRRPSQFTYRVMWALKLKGIPFEYIEQDLSDKSPLLLELNPVHKKVPVLIHNGKAICESLVILEYIDDTWPQNQLLSDDPFERALARFWAHFADKDRITPASKVLMAAGEEHEKSRKETLEFLGTIESHAFVGDRKFLGGESIGLADLAMGKLTVWLEALEEAAEVKLVDPVMFPRLHAWIQDFKDAPGIKENLPDRDQMLSAFKKRKEMILASK